MSLVNTIVHFMIMIINQVYIDEFYPQYTTSATVVDTDLLTLTVYDEDDDDGGTPQSHTGFITDNSCPGTDNWFKFLS